MTVEEEHLPLLHIKEQNLGIWGFLKDIIWSKDHSFNERIIYFNGKTDPSRFVPNVVCNQKYSLLTFLPKVLYEQFKYFFNFFYLMVALLQFIPALRTGPLFTYIAPLLLVLFVTVSKEAIDDIRRYIRDKECNNKKYKIITSSGVKEVKSCKIEVGNIIEVNTNDRIPADILFLRTNDPTGTVFVRTDQLDGETDWKVKRALGITQHFENIDNIFQLNGMVHIEAPKKDIYTFNGTIQYYDPCISQVKIPDISIATTKDEGTNEITTLSNLNDINQTLDSGSNSCRNKNPIIESLMLDNTIWANSVLTCGKIYGLVIYTGIESRSLMNTCGQSLRTKIGLLDTQVNTLSKILFVLLIITSFFLVFCKGFDALWYISFGRFMLLLSSIIPISLRVNLEMAKIFYSAQILHDKKMKEVTVRSSIPEELGRVDYLLTDKTGTLTQNSMVVQTLHTGHTVYHPENFSDLKSIVQYMLSNEQNNQLEEKNSSDNFNDHDNFILNTSVKSWKYPLNISHIQNFLLAIALCHNIFPRSSLDDNKDEISESTTLDLVDNEKLDSEECMVEFNQKHIVYQSSSPDEIALVTFAASLGLRLVERTNEYMELDLENSSRRDLVFNINSNISNIQTSLKSNRLSFCILACFPFCSTTKRMGILLEYQKKYIYFSKGAESVMVDLLKQKGSGWLLEECTNMARLGLRTLVFAYRYLSQQEYEVFNNVYSFPCTSLVQRNHNLNNARKLVEKDMELLGLTGVEDKLQMDVHLTLEAFRYAGIKIWLLTGDKLETALCIAISAGIKPKNFDFFILKYEDKKHINTCNKNKSESIHKISQLDIISNMLHRYILEMSLDHVLVVEGLLLNLCLNHFPQLLIHAAAIAPAVVWCRCSPSQKKELVLLLKNYHIKYGEYDNVQLFSHDHSDILEKGAISHLASRTRYDRNISNGPLKRRKKERKGDLSDNEVNKKISILSENISNIESHGSLHSLSVNNMDEWSQEEFYNNSTQIHSNNSIINIGNTNNSRRLISSTFSGISRSCRICAVGDGGNDVGMIQAADIGIGIVGKEGQQAANVADISLHEFADLRPLFLWHGRHAYQNSAKLAHFVIHRGLIIASMQCVFSALFYFIPVALFQGWLAVGYATYYTMAPVFSLVFDKDVNESTAMLYPELYRHLKSGRAMSIKIFFCWVWKSLYQGAIIMLGAILMFKDNILMNLVSITFTTLILSEILNVVTEIHHWNIFILSSCIASLLIYFISFFLLKSYFDLYFIFTYSFWGKICVLTLIAWGPVILFKIIKKSVHPPRYYKLMQH
ncbi:phospholipid-translocating P-type ATPase, flippase family protein [Cryptosporidium muris RN66]|uniref:Phospholipid-translocating P-type ATPase, flippase family protein n=1 Tax=Cryptosporidium muris (strain RN66) TaxID=441375 RepID=B6AH63_CRYMR|nr:phospholipid-translocating P-type ATPase, flippase family protein [Cryptosporidium muris RN66]EEA07554.1 phospholipid-translocating P-type ATPase, flippase family protein [Cryptosporidium muris RN66]|eukprot:XP_002141903.1 phospholipid-translocating P-type ATPase, flippase family protein [Cryptosporidium muris RN66]